jgi:hypothetical protein
MTKTDPTKSSFSEWWAKRPLLLTFGSLGLIVIVVGGAALLLDSHITRLEDSLRYTPQLPPEEAEAPADVSGERVGHLVYVPAYSHVYSRGGEASLVEITLSVRNIDPAHPITLVAVDYYDTNGRRVRRFVERPRKMAPLATTEFLVEERDASGGSGANFLVEWTADEAVNPPLAEAVMVGEVRGHYGVSFARPGVPLERSP